MPGRPSKRRSSDLDKETQEIAQELIRGLAIAPGLNRKVPCFAILPAMLSWFGIALKRLSDQSSVSLTYVLRANYGDVLDAFAAFANSTWTDEERRTFESCKCGRHNRADVRAVKMEIRDMRSKNHTLLHEGALQIFKLLGIVLDNMKSSHVNVVKLERPSNKRGKWPASPSQFIPNGAVPAVSGYTRWSDITSNPMPIEILSRLTFYCPSLIPAMNESTTLLPTLDCIFRYLIEEFRELIKDKVTSDRWRSFLRDILSFYYIFLGDWFQDQLRLPDFVLKHINPLRSIYHSLNDFILLLDTFTFPNGNKEVITMGLGSTGIAIYATSSFLAIEPLPLHPSFVPYFRKLHQTNTDNSFGMLLLDVMSLRNQRKCARISCTETGEDTKTNLKVCSSCEGVRYYSRDCQMLDWKDHHKPICKLMKVLVPFAKTYNFRNMKAETFRSLDSTMKREANMSDEDIALVREYINQHTRKPLEEIMHPIIYDALYRTLHGQETINVVDVKARLAAIFS